MITMAFADAGDQQQAMDDDGQNRSVLVLNEKTQAITGLQTTVLEASHFGAEYSVSGKALTLQPLLVLRNRYLELLAQHQQALAKLKQAEQNKQRQQDLFRHGVTSQHNLQEQQLQWHTEKSVVAANSLQTKAIVDEARLMWGNTLTAWVVTSDSTQLTDFLSGRSVLLQITLPADKTLVTGNPVIYVEASGYRHKASKAVFISDAPQMDSAFPGQRYFFQTQGKSIKPGMRVVAWIAEKKQAASGVMLAKSAAIWMLDQLFVYVKSGKDTFSRRLVNDYKVTSEGYFAVSGFDAGEEIVTTGAQMLLSEEQRRQIPDEDD
ncbi:hypothetical protein [Crenothrix sp.]|uniref:hypothetical protein n=1 Tax=Crenothrix sp. TaxID=3100433 RepID=UPI00374DF7AE